MCDISWGKTWYEGIKKTETKNAHWFFIEVVCWIIVLLNYHDRTDEKLSIQVVSPELTGHLPFIAYHYMLDWVFVNLSGSVFWSKDGNQVLK